MSEESVKLWRYVLPSDRGEGWAEIVLGSSGFFAVVSDFGDYAFAWRHHGHKDFREFIVRISDDWGYVASKLSCADEYQNRETLRAVRAEIVRLRRDRSISKYQALDAWNELGASFDRLYSAHDFSRWYQDSDGASLIGDAAELAVYDYPASVRAFCQKTMPRLAAILRAELAAEKAAA